MVTITGGLWKTGWGFFSLCFQSLYAVQADRRPTGVSYSDDFEMSCLKEYFRATWHK